MPDSKISALTNLGAAPATNDELALVDTSAATTKKLAISDLFTSPTLVTPALGTPASGTLTNCTGLPAAGISETSGSGNVVRVTSATLVTPALGTPASGVLTSCTGLPEGGLSLTDITTANASTTAHGFLKKLDNTSTNFMNGAGNWAAPAGSSAFTLIEHQAPSAAASVDFTTLGTYPYFMVVFSLAGSANPQNLNLTFNNSGGTAYQYNQTTGAAGFTVTSGAAQIVLITTWNSGAGICGQFIVPQATRGSLSRHGVTVVVGGTNATTFAANSAEWASADSITSIKLAPDTGTMTGLVTLYGLKSA